MGFFVLIAYNQFMKQIFLVLVIFFISSCSPENKKTLNANLLISPDFNKKNFFIECTVADGVSLIDINFLLSTTLKSNFFKNKGRSLKIYFPELENLDEFILQIDGNLDDSIYMEFVNTLSLNAIDEIALCDFNEVEFKSFKYKSFDKSSENSFKDGVKNYTNAEILKCKYNPGYNYGTFRIAIEKFLYEIDLLNINYDFTYLQEDANDTHFIWINSFYNSDYSTILLNEWINNTEAINIKKEFLENAKCTESSYYRSFLLV